MDVGIRRSCPVQGAGQEIMRSRHHLGWDRTSALAGHSSSAVRGQTGGRTGGRTDVARGGDDDNDVGGSARLILADSPSLRVLQWPRTTPEPRLNDSCRERRALSARDVIPTNPGAAERCCGGGGGGGGGGKVTTLLLLPLQVLLPSSATEWYIC